jgi:Arc/MetJ-type ribon-helix-helix transcriptional regulator
MLKAERIGIRLEPQLREKLEKLVECGKFSSISEAVRQILKQFLTEYEKA